MKPWLHRNNLARKAKYSLRGRQETVEHGRSAESWESRFWRRSKEMGSDR